MQFMPEDLVAREAFRQCPMSLVGHWVLRQIHTPQRAALTLLHGFHPFEIAVQHLICEITHVEPTRAQIMTLPVGYLGHMEWPRSFWVPIDYLLDPESVFGDLFTYLGPRSRYAWIRGGVFMRSRIMLELQDDAEPAQRFGRIESMVGDLVEVNFNAPGQEPGQIGRPRQSIRLYDVPSVWEPVDGQVIIQQWREEETRRMSALLHREERQGPRQQVPLDAIPPVPRGSYWQGQPEDPAPQEPEPARSTSWERVQSEPSQPE